MNTRKQKRIDDANRLIEVIAGCGRKFFAHDGRVTRFEVDPNTRTLWIVDHYTGKRVWVSPRANWREFTNGGTLRGLILALGGYIRTGKPVWARQLGPWPSDYCNGDLWGYGDDMQKVRDAAQDLGITSADTSTPA